MSEKIKIFGDTHASTASFYRLAFVGLMMLFSLIRFVSYGWIKNFILILSSILPITVSAG
jgi:hypothetical protein